jgi:hypothetical protein
MSEIAQVIVEDLSKPQTPQIEAKDEPKKEVPLEPQIEAKDEPKKDDEPISVKFATLAKREKAIAEQKKEIEEKLSKIKQFELSRENIKKDPKGALESVGMTLEELIVAHLDQTDGKKPQGPTADEKIEALYKKLEEKEQAEKDRELQAQKEAEAQAVENFKSEIKKTLTSDLDKYELINLYESFDDVFEVIEGYFEETGEILAVEKAAEHVENHLFEEAQKLKKSKKLGLVEAVKEKAEEKQAVTSTLSPTLTNKQTPVTTMQSHANGRPLTTEESIAKAAALLKFR